MPDEPRQHIVIPQWHSLPVEVSRGQATDIPRAGKKAPDGIAIAATQLGEEGPVVLMLGLTHGDLSLAAVLPLQDWNAFTIGPMQAALTDAAERQREFLKRQGAGDEADLSEHE